MIFFKFCRIIFKMNNLGWYINLYYKFREYPITELNLAYKPNELKSLYSGLLKKLFILFQLDNRRDGDIEGLISKNNYDLMINKRAQNNLAQQEIQSNNQEVPILDSNILITGSKAPSRFSMSSNDNESEDQNRQSFVSKQSNKRWLVEPNNPNQGNMDVFYELMIKMIRVSLRRLMVETFAIDKYGKSLSKNAVNQIYKNRSEFQVLKEKLGGNMESGKLSDSSQENIQIISFPATVQQLKFQFLRYCITCKVYNNPNNINIQTQSNSSLSSNSHIQNNSQKSISSEQKQKHQQSIKQNKKWKTVSDNEIQQLIMRVSHSETLIFNKIIDKYLEELRKNGNNQVQIVGMKHIAQSMFEMAFGQPHMQTPTDSAGINKNRYRRELFEVDCQIEKPSDILSNNNILLATWFDLILFKQSPATLFEIIQQLVKLQDKYNYLDEMGVSTPSTIQPQNKPFYYKISSYHHLLILNSTKNVMVQSLCKINYLVVLFKDVIGDINNQNGRSFNQIKLKRYQQKGEGSASKAYENIQLTYDTKARKYIWKQQAMELLLTKWKIIANVITEVCVKNSKAFFAAIFEKCVQLLDKQLSLQVQLIEQLMNIAENISLESDIRQKDTQKSNYIRKAIYSIVKEIIGFGQNFSEHVQEGEGQQKLLNINNFINFKSQGNRYKQATFANRQESTEELSKWTEIINQNIYVYIQYHDNLELVIKLFKGNYIYIALWFTKFHCETKTLLKKVERDKLQTIFKKFNAEIPVLWESMTSDNQPQRGRSRFRRNDKNKYRTRISSIKLQKNLNLIQKKAIVLNYMVKSQLQLYSHYMLINYLNSQKNLTQFFQKQLGVKKKANQKPPIFEHELIKNMMLFTIDEQQDKVNRLDSEFGVDFVRKGQKTFTTNFMNSKKNSSDYQNIKTMNNLDRNETNLQIQDLMKAITQFQSPMNIQLDLKEHWKEKFGDHQIQYLGQLCDYIRYINQINYLYQFWTWTESTIQKKKQGKDDYFKLEKKAKLELLNTLEYKQDLDQIDLACEELQHNEIIINQLLLKGETNKILKQEKLSEMLKRVKIHNKQLYMIIQAILEGQNYFKLLGNNLLGRDQNCQFKQILQEIISLYKNNKRQKPTMRMFDKVKESLQYDQSIMIKKQSNAVKKNQQTIKMAPEIAQGIIQSASLHTSNSLFNKIAKRGGSVSSHFEFAPQFYKIQSKICRLNCLIASFEVGNNIFRNIKHHHLLSKQRLERLAIIGNKYYNKLQILLKNDKEQEFSQFLINQESLIRIKNVYEKKIMLMMITLININYHFQAKVKRYSVKGKKYEARGEFSNIPEEDQRNYSSVLAKYSQLLKRFIYWRIKENIKRMEERQNFQKSNSDNQRKQGKQFSICHFLQQIMQLTQKKEQYSQQTLLVQLQRMIEKETNIKFSEEFKKTYELESQSILIYKTEEEKVQYLRKKLSYYLMRQMYFNLNYDNDFLDQKSTNSKRNFIIYQQRILKFYEQIIQLDYQQYIQRKQQQLKKRSVHLKNYQFKYEQQPAISKLQQQMNQLICCLFNQLLITYTTSVQYRMFTHKHKPISENSYKQQQLFQQYCASQYQKQLPKQQVKIVKKKKPKKKQHKDSIASIFANIFFSDNKQEKVSQVAKQITTSFADQSNQNWATVLVYTPQKFQLSQSIKIYLKIITDYDYHISNQISELRGSKQGNGVLYTLRQQPLTEMQLEIIKNNERSLITLLKSQFLQRINQAKCKLIRKNLISNIEKLYINLDVRHKVFQSFKDRILNYEMQKAKIYHQYMDYIRGLKLDVYSHMAGEESLPYIKIIHAVKLYRLNIKKMELEKRVNQEFQKNLQKWNAGIQNNLKSYDEWLLTQEKMWEQKEIIYEIQKKSLFDIYHAVSKERSRQNKMIKKRMTSSVKSISICNQIALPKQIQIPKALMLGTKSPHESLLKKSIMKHKQITFSKKLDQSNKVIPLTPSTPLVNPYLIKTYSQSTKPQTRYQKGNQINKSTSGPRGIAIKYQMNFQMINKQKDQKQRYTQNYNVSAVKTASPTTHQRYLKRYCSAQKFGRKKQSY